MTQPAKAQEPSMEEILASIRRIIADDEAKPAASDSQSATTAEPARPVIASKPEPVRTELPREELGKRQPNLATAPRSAPIPPMPSPVSAPAAQVPDDMDSLLAELDDEVVVPAAARAARHEPEVLELTESMAMPRPGSFRTIDPQNDVEFSDNATGEPPPRSNPPPRPKASERSFESMAKPSQTVPQDDRPAQPLLSGSTMAAVDSAFNSLAHTVFAQNARTLEDLVKEMLRPMLKSWLDDNLPQVVERIVKAEIERVSRGR